jgi:hypothetical protein
MLWEDMLGSSRALQRVTVLLRNFLQTESLLWCCRGQVEGIEREIERAGSERSAEARTNDGNAFLV